VCNIENTISQAKFDSQYKLMVCDPTLSNDISGYKRDHIAFKVNNFKRLNEFTNFEVVNHHNCKLGKWIEQQEQQNKPYTKLSAWNTMKEAHAKVHTNVQQYVTQNASHIEQKYLEEKALDIENDTLNVFAALNNVLKTNCKN